MSCLYHEGILGQKWGVRHGPPYPLGFSAHSAKQKRLNSKSRIDGDPETGGNGKRKGLTDKQKTAIKVGMAAVGVGLAAYGGYRLYKSGALDPVISKLSEKGKKTASGDAAILKASFTPNENVQKFCDEFGFTMKNNSDRTVTDLNPSYTGGRDSNCGPACVAGIADFLGIDNVVAKRHIKIDGDDVAQLAPSDIRAMFRGEDSKFVSVLGGTNDHRSKVVNHILETTKDSDRACGFLDVHVGEGTMGHYMAWYKEGKNVTFKDELLHGDSNACEKYFKAADLGRLSSFEINRVDTTRLTSKFADALDKRIAK